MVLRRQRHGLKERTVGHRQGGFTLIELLVVISIIAIIVVAMIPTVSKTVVRAKEQSVSSNCASIEAGLANYAQRHGGTYPALAVDVMAPFHDDTQILGDPVLTGNTFPQGQGNGLYGITGDYGHRNYGSDAQLTVHQQLARARATTLTPGNIGYARYFDSLIASDAMEEYPANAFSGSLMSRSNRMKNIMGIDILVSALTDIGDPAEMNDPNIDFPWLNCTTKGDDSFAGKPSPYFYKYEPIEFTWNLGQLPLNLPIDPSTFDAQQFDKDCVFGTDKGDFFAEGNFAYVPLLSTSVFPLEDDPTTLRDEKYQWGSRVTAYMMFGYGSKDSKQDRFRDQQLEYLKTGLPGYGDAGVDTRYEELVLELFQGAVYFNKVGI
jgi:prepilin-type N-terminal cleavage/methylation domain-containing protein